MMKSVARAIAAGLGSLALCAGPAPAATIRVPSDQPTIQAGIDAAAGGDTVIVSPGTFLENIDFLGKAIILRSQQGADVTVIDGNRAGSVVTFSSGETAFTAIDAFTIRNGEAGLGGGIYCNGASPTIASCVITGNVAAGAGGGVFCEESAPAVLGCTVVGNSTVNNGGGLFFFESAPMIRGCTISGNSTGARDGGGIYGSESSLTITNCTISGNMAVKNGGGLCFFDSPSSTIVNSTLSGNSAQFGGGIYCSVYSSPTMTNSILWDDDASSGGPEIALFFGANLTIRYSDVRGGEEGAHVDSGALLIWGEGNIDSDPLFAGGGDYHLGSGSPCIDAGMDSGVHADIDGDERPYGPGFEMGSDEYVGPYWALELDASYDAGTLSLDFTLGTPETAIWSTYLIFTEPTVEIVSLWNLPVPAMVPPVEVPLGFPLPGLGVLGIYSRLFTGEGPQASDLEWVFTGG